MSDSSRSGSGGVGITTVVTIIFVVLKLVGAIDWSWWWVLSPTGIVLVACLIVYVAWVTERLSEARIRRWSEDEDE